MRLLPHASALGALLLLGATTVGAVYRDEVGAIDFHHELLGLPQQTTTFFHRPRKDDKASLIYTLSDVGVLGAVNPSSGALVWRQQLNETISTYPSGGFLRASEGENWVCSAYGSSVHVWNALTGRNSWWVDFAGTLRDLEIMEMTESEAKKDVLALFEEAGATVLRRLDGASGRVVWEFRDTVRDVPLQASTNIQHVFVISLNGSPSAYGIKVSVLDTATGRRVDEIVLGTKGDVHAEQDVMFVGANSAAPIVAWTDATFSKLKINVLGTKKVQEYPLVADTVSVDIHAPHLLQSEPHFLVHSRTKTANKAEVYHVNLKTSAITKAYELPLLPGLGAFSTSSEGANVWFTRITQDEIVLTSSTSHGILGRWPLKPDTDGKSSFEAIHGVSEVIRKADNSYAIRSAAVSTTDDWVLVRNGEIAWSRPEGLTATLAAAWAEIPKIEALAKTLDQEAHINPVAAYIHRVNRHINDLQYLPDYLASVPKRFLTSLFGGTDLSVQGNLLRDAFGFNKLAILATQRGRLYAIDTGNHGKVAWSVSAFELGPGETWDVKGIFVDDNTGTVTVRGALGEFVVAKVDSGEIVQIQPRGDSATVQSTAVVESTNGPWLLPVGVGGKIGELAAASTPKQTVVVRGEDGSLKGLHFVPHGEQFKAQIAWSFAPPSGYSIVDIATRPSHDPVASIGRVLGDRQVRYKYLNPNTLVVAVANSGKSSLSVFLLDTVSGAILTSSTYDGVDANKPISCVLAENWFVCAFFGAYSLRDGSSQTLKGYQVAVTDLYESEMPNDRGPLNDAANFSSLHPIDSPTAPPLPAVVSQAYIISQPIILLAVTQTRQGIASRQVLGYLPQAHGVMAIARQALEPRRPVGRDPTAGEVEAEGLSKYQPAIELDPRGVISHEREVIGVKKILATPAVVESTSLIIAYGIDVFGTRAAPSLVFDILGKGFNKVTLIGTVVALMAGVVVLGPMVRKKQINAPWKA